jgi:DNA-3-methyladenine glycosylase I
MARKKAATVKKSAVNNKSASGGKAASKAGSPKPLAMDDRPRCAWAARDPQLAHYHDNEWGRPIATDSGHLERIALEIFQCGLSWKIVLVKQPALKKAFGAYKIDYVAGLTSKDVDRLVENADIIRNRKKIEATIHNAGVIAGLARTHGSYRKWLAALPAKTDEQVAALYPLFKKTFKFMGPETTKCYLWGVGKVAVPHEPTCWMAKTGRVGKSF